MGEDITEAPVTTAGKVPENKPQAEEAVQYDVDGNIFGFDGFLKYQESEGLGAGHTGLVVRVSLVGPGKALENWRVPKSFAAKEATKGRDLLAEIKTLVRLQKIEALRGTHYVPKILPRHGRISRGGPEDYYWGEFDPNRDPPRASSG